MMLNPSACAVGARIVKPEDFYREQHRMVFEACVKLSVEGKEADAVTVAEELKKRRLLTKAGGRDMLHALVEFCPSTSNTRIYANAVHDTGVRRRIIRSCQETVEEAYSGSGEVCDLLDRAESRIFGVASDVKTEENLSMRDLADTTLERIDLAARGMLTGGVRAGLWAVDHFVGGFQKKNLIILAARPSVGKTSLACNIAEHIARTEGAVAFYSLEMSGQEIFERMTCTLARVSSNKIRSGSLTPDEYAGLVGAMGQLEGLPLHLDETPGLSVLQLRQKARRLAARVDLKLVVVDYLQLMYMGDANRGENRNNEMARISKAMKQLAREIDVPVLCLSQLSRASEQREDRRPRLSDLRDSGAIEQDADIVLFLHDLREDASARGEMEVIVAKNRTGPRGTGRMAFTPDWTHFQDIPREPVYAGAAAGDEHPAGASHYQHPGYVVGMDDPEDRPELAHPEPAVQLAL